MRSDGWTAFDEAEPEESACLYGYLLIWHVFRGVVVETWTERRATAMYTHWMAMPRKGWIASAERKPTAEDADIMNCVLARHEYDGIMVTGWHQFGHNRFLTHWMKTPQPPNDEMDYRNCF